MVLSVHWLWAITDEIPFDIPENWAWCRLGEIAFYKKGPFGSSITKAMFVPKSKNTYKVYEQKNAINKNAFIGNYYISKEKFDELKGFEVFPNDVIVSCAGTIGETFILPEGIERGIINQALMRIMVYKRQIIPFYLIYFDSVLKNEANQQGKGIAIKNIPSFDVLKNFLIPLPPLSEQRRIVEKIEKLLVLVDDLETNKTDLQSYIKQAKSKVLEMAVRGELVPQNPEDEPASVLLERIKKEQKTSKSKGKTTEHNTHYEEELPKNWAKTTLGECFEWGSGGTPTSSVKKYYDGNIPWLVIGDLNDNYINTSDKTITQFGLENSSAKLVPKGTLLLAMYGSIGKLGIAGMPLATNQAIAFALENKEINTKYLFYYLLSVRSSLNLLGKGATQKNISQSIIKDFHFPLPPLAEQHRIVEKIEHIFAVLEELEENIL